MYHIKTIKDEYILGPKALSFAILLDTTISTRPFDTQVNKNTVVDRTAVSRSGEKVEVVSNTKELSKALSRKRKTWSVD